MENIPELPDEVQDATDVENLEATRDILQPAVENIETMNLRNTWAKEGSDQLYAPESDEEPSAPSYNAPSEYDLMRSAFYLENDVEALSKLWNEKDYAWDTEYDKYADENNYGYEDIEGFDEIKSEEHAKDWRASVAKENRHREIQAQGDTAGVVFSNLFAGITSPTSLIPFLGPAQRVYKSAQIAEGAAIGGLTLAGIEAGREALFQATQYDRTQEESINNTIFAGIVGSVLGVGIGALKSTKELADTSKKVENDVMREDSSQVTAEDINRIDTGEELGESVGAARAADMDMSLEDSEMANSFGIGDMSKKMKLSLSAFLRQSPFKSARNVGDALAENDFLTEGNKRGVPSQHSAETEAEIMRSEIVESMEFGKNSYKQMTKGGLRMKKSEFNKLVSDALDSSDMHEIPEVAATAKIARKLIKKRTKEAVDAGMLDKKYLDEQYSSNYLHRIWNKAKVKANKTELLAIITKHFEGTQAAHVKKNPNYKTEETWELQSRAEDAVRRIINGDEDSAMDLLKTDGFGDALSAPLKARTLNIPNKLIRDFIERDFEKVVGQYNNKISADIALKNKFGDVGLKDQWEEILDEAEVQIKKAHKAGDKKLALKLEKELEYSRRAIIAMRDRLRGTYKMPDSPDDVIYRTGRAMRGFNYVRMLGSMTISAIPDLGGMVVKNGFGNTLGMIHKRLTASKAIKEMSKQELKEAGIGIDMILGTREMKMAQLMDPITGTTKLEKGIELGSEWMGKLSLMDQWNTTMKQMAGMTAQNRMIKGIKSLADGTASQKQITRLAKQGIGKEDAERMAELIAKHGDDTDGINLSGVADWDDDTLRTIFKSGLHKTVNSTIVTPGIGDTPMWMSSGTGKLLGQFKTFAFAVVNRMTIPAAQQKDAAVLNGIMISLTLGYMSHYIRAAINGNLDELEDYNAQTMAWHAFDRSGLGGVFTEGFHMANKVGSNRLTSAMGIKTGKAGRMQSRGAAGVLVGPSFGTAQDIFGMVGAITNSEKEWTEKETERAYRLLPFNSLFYVRTAFNHLYKD